MSRPDLEPLALTARAVAAEWGLRLGPPFALARHSYVAPAGADAVLKIAPTRDDEADDEAAALELWDGDGAVRVLRHDRARRALLLERARPGSDISTTPEDEATAIAVAVGLRLWRPAAEPFRWIGDHVPRWLDERERSGYEDAEFVTLARELYTSLDVGRAVLVHGDLHHHNILRAGDLHLAIDPKAMLGEPEFDVPPFLWNPLGSTMEIDVVRRRLTVFVTAGLDEERIRRWAVIRGAYLGADAHQARLLSTLV